jgi:hypothetical protein
MRTRLHLRELLRIGERAQKRKNFYKKETDKFWSVCGDADTETGQATCYGSVNKKDGSWIQIHRSLVDGELSAIARHIAWEIEGDGRGTLRWNFYNANKDAFIDGTNFTYDIRNKNTILILQIVAQALLRGALEHPLFHPRDARQSPEPLCQLRTQGFIHARRTRRMRRQERENLQELQTRARKDPRRSQGQDLKVLAWA